MSNTGRTAFFAVPRAFARRVSLARFSRDRRGVTAVEFSLIAVPFFGLLMAIFQSGLYFFTSEAVQAAVQNAARNLYTGQAQGAGLSTAAAFVNTYVCPPGGNTQLSALIDCSKLIVDVRTAPTNGSFAGIDMTPDFYQSGATTQFCPGGPGDIVIVRVIYPMPVYLPILGTSTGRDVTTVTAGTVNNVPNNAGMKQLVIGSAVFQNEPFANTYQPPSGC